MTASSTAPYPVSALRAAALHLQALTPAPGAEPPPTPEVVYDIVKKLGCVQIDTLYRVERSQYLVIWSRLGQYDPADFDRLIFEPGERRLYEYWQHAASIIPLEHYRYSTPQMKNWREKPSRYWVDWLNKPEHQQTLQHVRERIVTEGAQRAADFKYDGPKRGPWWDWKPSKSALEYLFGMGELMIANRVNFQRVYDLRERVLPEWVDTTPISADEANRFRVEAALRRLGACRPLQIAEYAYMYRRTAGPHIQALIDEGVAVEVRCILADGQEATFIAHRDNLPLLEQAAAGAITAGRTTFLSPFDSVFWGRDRDQDLWGFRQVLEAYKRAEDRIWGYFSLAILHRDRLVGRFDPKLERQDGVMRLEHLHLEPGVEPADDLVADVAAAMRDFMAFHGATDLVVAHSNPPEFGDKLARSL